MLNNFVPGINSCLKIIKSNIPIKNIYINKIELFSNKRIKPIIENKIIQEKIKILNKFDFEELLPGVNSQGIIIEINNLPFSVDELINQDYCKVF